MTTAVAPASLLDTTETFSARSERDALGRVLVAVSPDGSEVAYWYDEGGGLQTVELKHRGSSMAQTVVGEIEYDARGQRTRVVYGSTSSPTSGFSTRGDSESEVHAVNSSIRSRTELAFK